MALLPNLVRVAGALGATVLALSLAACSSGQSVAEGCAIAQESLSAGGSHIDQLTAEALAGGGSMKSLIDPLSDALKAAEKKVTNPEVSAALQALGSEFLGLGELLDRVDLPEMPASPPDSEQVAPEQANAEKQLEAIGKELEERNAALELADLNLQALCETP